jgi:Leucine-rich repeat (LRR) protein
LKTLALKGNKNLTNIDLVSELTSLRELDLSFCHEIKALPKSLAYLRNLKSINLTYMHSLEDISVLSKLDNIQSLIISDRSLLDKLPSQADKQKLEAITTVLKLPKGGVAYY